MKSNAGPFKMKSPFKNNTKRLPGESDLDYKRRVYGINSGSRSGNYTGPKTRQVGKTVKGSVQKIV